MRESYIQMRNSKQYDLNWFSNYSHTMGVPVIDIKLLNFYISQNLNNILSFLDSKFNLHILTDKDNNFIKVIQ